MVQINLGSDYIYLSAAGVCTLVMVGSSMDHSLAYLLRVVVYKDARKSGLCWHIGTKRKT